MLGDWLRQGIEVFSQQFPSGTILSYTFMIKAFIASALVSLICGSIGSLVVGNRMAFFSDALAHTSYAGVALGLLIGVLIGLERGNAYYSYGIPTMTVLFGILIGVAIIFVRHRTGLSSDTVIGVFFAGAVGFGAILLKPLGQLGYFRLERFIFGDPLAVSENDMVALAVLGVLTAVLLLAIYNDLVFASFNPSLARSRNIRVALCNYLFIMLLAAIVGLCVNTVGVLLINAMLVVPAATAANLCRNMRELFWTSIVLSLLANFIGIWFSFSFRFVAGGSEVYLGAAGTMIVVSVLLFFASMVVGPWWKGRLVAGVPAPAKA